MWVDFTAILESLGFESVIGNVKTIGKIIKNRLLEPRCTGMLNKAECQLCQK